MTNWKIGIQVLGMGLNLIEIEGDLPVFTATILKFRWDDGV